MRYDDSSDVLNCTVHISTEHTHHFIEYTPFGAALEFLFN